jgi:hypothetical protein
VEYKSKELILDEIREKEPDLVEILERTNPLPNTIILSNIQIEYYKDVNSIIEPKEFILKKYEDNKDHFSHYSSQYKNIENIISVLGILTY